MLRDCYTQASGSSAGGIACVDSDEEGEDGEDGEEEEDDDDEGSEAEAERAANGTDSCGEPSDVAARLRRVRT